MPSTPVKFSVKTADEHGNLRYVVDPEGDVTLSSLTPIDPIHNKDVWTIERPPADLTVPGAIRRTYHNVEYLMSAKAASVIPSEHCSTGAQVVVKFGNYYALVADNKPYWMSPGGSMDEGEDSVADCAVRELREELAISDVTTDQLVLAGHFSFDHQNRVIGDKLQHRTTIVYGLGLDQERAEHLNMADLFNDPDKHVKTVYAKDLNCDLGETEIVTLVESGHIASLPTKIAGKQFDGHHRETLLLFDGEPEAAQEIDHSYLSSYDVVPKGLDDQ